MCAGLFVRVWQVTACDVFKLTSRRLEGENHVLGLDAPIIQRLACGGGVCFDVTLALSGLSQHCFQSRTLFGRQCIDAPTRILKPFFKFGSIHASPRNA